MLSRLFQGRYARNFNFACLFPLKAILPWFNYQCVGSQVFSCLPRKLFNDKTWVGFDVYVVLSWDQSFSFDNLDSDFPPFLVVYFLGSGSNVEHTAVFSLGKDGLIGSEHRLVMFHVPRENFQEELNECWQIGAFFSTTISDHVEIEMCGIRIVYENDLQELIQTITECTLGSSEVNHQRYHQTFENMQKKILCQAEGTSENNAVEGETPRAIDLGYFYPSKKVQEDRTNSTSQQGAPRDSGFPGGQGNTPTEKEHDITEYLLGKYYKVFDPELMYNSCFPPSEIPKGFNTYNDDYSVRLQLPDNSSSESNWIGLALWASFSINEQATTNAETQVSNIPHYLFCHLETERGGLEPLYAYRTTNEELKWLNQVGGFIWLSYIPRGWFSNKLNQCSFMEASFGSENLGLWAQKCGLCLVYEQEEFERMILHCTQVFWDDGDLRTEILLEKYVSVGSLISLAPTLICLMIMAETPLIKSRYSITEWKENTKHLLKKFFKFPVVILLNLNGKIISMLRGFEPKVRYNFCLPRKEIPEWFDMQFGRPVQVQLIPEQLDDSWLGFVICASFSVHENPTAFRANTGFEINVNLLCHFQIDEYCVPSMFRIPKEEFKWKYIRGFIWLTYIPRWSFPDLFNQQRLVEIKIHTNCPGLQVQNCGIRLLFKQDLEQFENAIIDCLTSFHDDLDPIFEYLNDREPTDNETNNEIDRSYVKPHKYPRTSSELLDFYQESHNGRMIGPICQNMCFPPTEVLEWFRNHNEGYSVEIELPSNLSYDNDWVGLALCAYFSDLDPPQPTSSIDNSDKDEIAHHLICRLQTEKGDLKQPHVYQTNNEEFKWLHREGTFVWLSFIPRAWFSDQLNQCSNMEASFMSCRRALCVQKCGLRLVFQHNEDEFMQTIAHCTTSLLKYQEKRLGGSNDTDIKGKGKLVLE